MDSLQADYAPAAPTVLMSFESARAAEPNPKIFDVKTLENFECHTRTNGNSYRRNGRAPLG